MTATSGEESEPGAAALDGPPAEGTRRRQGRRREQRRRRRRIWIWLTAAALVILLPVALVGGYLLWLGSSFDGTVGRIQHACPDEAGRPAAVEGAIHLLLIGSDSRTGLRDSGGAVSAGIYHYTTADDVDRLVAAVAQVR